MTAAIRNESEAQLLLSLTSSKLSGWRNEERGKALKPVPPSSMSKGEIGATSGVKSIHVVTDGKILFFLCKIVTNQEYFSIDVIKMAE